MEWLSNPWIVGIGGGVLSGLLVTVISRLLLSKKDSKEYAQKLFSANREVIYAIRQGISEGHVPDRQIVETLLTATARKYGVDRNDVYNPPQIGQELTKEIMDSSFISAKIKKEYCDQLESLSTSESVERSETATRELVEPVSRPDLAEYRSRMVTMMSMMLGFMTGLMTVVLVFSDKFAIEKRFANSSLDSAGDPLAFLLIPIAVALIAALLVFLAAFVKREIESLRAREPREDPQTKDHRDDHGRRAT